MVTSQDVRAARFDKSFRGYRTEDVDNFLDKVTTQLEADAAQLEELKTQVQELQSENQRLKKGTETYEADADMLKSALINAQRMGESVIREANQKSDDILHRANLRADDIVRDANELLQKATERADEIVNEALDQKAVEEREYERVRLEVTRFKADVLNLYRSHVETLSRLPEYQKEEAEPAEAEEAPAAIPEELKTEAEPETAEPAAAEEENAEPDFWSKDENELKMDPPPAAEAEADYAAFQGVKFSE
jgi:cell division initiation protein